MLNFYLCHFSKVNDDDASHAADIGQEIWSVSFIECLSEQAFC